MSELYLCPGYCYCCCIPFPGAAEGVSLHLCPSSTCGGPVRSPSPQWAHFRGQRGGKAQACPRPPNTPSPLLPASAQALSLKESEKTALSEKLMGTQHSLAAISLEMERQKRDAQSRQEQDRVGQAGAGGPPSEPGLGMGGAQHCPRGTRGSALGAASRLSAELPPSLGVPIGGRWHGSAL